MPIKTDHNLQNSVKTCKTDTLQLRSLVPCCELINRHLFVVIFFVLQRFVALCRLLIASMDSKNEPKVSDSHLAVTSMPNQNGRGKGDIFQVMYFPTKQPTKLLAKVFLHPLVPPPFLGDTPPWSPPSLGDTPPDPPTFLG